MAQCSDLLQPMSITSAAAMTAKAPAETTAAVTQALKATSATARC